MAVVLIFGGGPNHELLGFYYWKNPGPVNEYTVSGASGRLAAFFLEQSLSLFSPLPLHQSSWSSQVARWSLLAGICPSLANDTSGD